MNEPNGNLRVPKSVPRAANGLTIRACRPLRAAGLEDDEEMQYTVIVERSPRNFSAYVPDLPGCIVTNATREGVVQLMREAIQFHIEDLRERGEPVPAPQSTAAVVEVREARR